MKNPSKQAFTIVELVIVIAVIGILAAILIPVFSNIISRANAKAALSDARSTLSAYLTENLAIVDGQIAASIVIFIKKANMYYIYGYANTGPDMGKLMQSGGNPYKMSDLAELIDAYNCTDREIIGTEEEDNYAFFLWPHDQPSGSGGMKSRTKDMDEVNSNFINLSDKMGDDLPNTSEVFDGFLIGMIVDANEATTGDGTRPGEKPGGGIQNETKFKVEYVGGADDVLDMPESPVSIKERDAT
ncbi:MAG: type II secretion system protein, partial [Clostridiaceae bacterium]|nr:type II secretion system protein [Clostridiaceae bacterium]